MATPIGQKKYGLPNSLTYGCWFEFVVPSVSAKVCANYRIDLTETGIEQLSKHGLSGQFPAVIQATENEPTFYFAGDFAENPVVSFTAKMSFGKQLNRLFSKKNEKTIFFDTFYTPLIENILSDYYSNQLKK
ncbi:MAG: hypothetical protein F9K37_14145 [Bacteroidales bacterium]|nr:MAG: hypothetical protein F9K37_14145 [Bacteroidales bacterium]